MLINLTNYDKFCRIMSMKMKRFAICLFAMLLSTTMVLLCSCDNPPENKILDVIISNNFYTDRFYVGDEIDLSEYTVTVKFSLSADKVFTLDNVYRKTLDTSKAGTFTFTLSYLDNHKDFTYTVYAVTLLDTTYSGDPIIIYKNEPADLTGIKFRALYSNGHEEFIDLSNAIFDLSALSYSLSPISIPESYQGNDFEIKVVVTNREIKTSSPYKLIDKTGTYTDHLISFIDGKAVIYAANTNANSPATEITLSSLPTNENYNIASATMFTPTPLNVIFYNVDDSIVCEAV